MHDYTTTHRYIANRIYYIYISCMLTENDCVSRESGETGNEKTGECGGERMKIHW